MVPTWIITNDGAFVCGDRDTGITSYAEPTSIFAESAARAAITSFPAVVRLALNILKGERDRRLGRDLETAFDADNWSKLALGSSPHRSIGDTPLGHYAVEICDRCGRPLRSFNLPIAPDMVVSNQRWIPGATIPSELADDRDANIIWYGLNEGRWPRNPNGIAVEASDELTDEDGELVAVWRARYVDREA